MNWISIKERLPDFEDKVLITIRYEFAGKMYYTTDFGYFIYCVIAGKKKWEDVFEYSIERCSSKVIAWMQIPEPYQEKEPSFPLGENG